VKESGEFHRVAEVKRHRVYLEEVAADPARFVFHVPSSTVQELVRHGALGAEGAAVWSLWGGYLRDRSGVRLRTLLEEQGIPMPHIHTSGHASVADLGRLVAALSPDRLIPIHSEAGSRFGELFPNVELHSDGSWWEV
jgi:ribonuclease J